MTDFLNREEAVLLVVDVFRPMPRPADWINRIVTHGFLRPCYAHPVSKRAGLGSG